MTQTTGQPIGGLQGTLQNPHLEAASVCDQERVGSGEESLMAMPPEPQEGNIEYKYVLVDPTVDRLEHLITQMKWRISEGGGDAIYEIGVHDDGACTGLGEEDLEASIEVLRRIASSLDAHVSILRKFQGKKGQCCEALVRKIPEDGDFTDVRVAVVGNVDSGKSTLVGVLTSGRLDNGRGLARSNVFRHRHELESGRTSSISQQIMGLDIDGKLVNGEVRDYNWAEIVQRSAKVYTFIDLCGHERYIRTTVHGMTGSVPDYVFVVVGANMGVLRMTREHLGLALALKFPLIFVVTKVDMCPPNILKQTIDDVSKILRSPGVRKMPLVVKSEADVVSASRSLAENDRVAPIFLTSAVTGERLDLLRMLLNLLPPRKMFEHPPDAPAAVHIDDIFQVEGVGTVVGGTMLQGSMTLTSKAVIGPDEFGRFLPVQFKSFMNKRVSVSRVSAGQAATFAIKKLKKNQIRKGMILADAALQPRACMMFTAEVVILNHHTTIVSNYQPVVHCLTVTQSCRVVEMGTDGAMRTGDRAKIVFEFMYRPEYMVLGTRMIFREGRAKGIGKVVGITYMDGETVVLDEGTGSTAPTIPMPTAPPTSAFQELAVDNAKETLLAVASECA